MNLTWKRTLRTASSERFLALRDGKDLAAVDLHYLANGTVAGTVIILKGSGLKDADIEPLLSSLDDEFLPDVDLEHGNLTYTVVLGEVLGNWEAETKEILCPLSIIRSHSTLSKLCSHGLSRLRLLSQNHGARSFVTR